MRPRAFAGLLLCALLLGATWPTLSALPGIPAAVVAGDAYAVTQGTGDFSINASLAENLTARDWADIVSPELLGLGTLSGEPVIVRAVDPGAFFDLECGPCVLPPAAVQPYAFVGAGLADRLGLRPGRVVTVVGSYTPRVAFLHVTGVYATTTLANDEVLVDEAMGRFLTGLGAPNFHTIRVRTADPAALLAFLDSFGTSAHVSGPGIARADIHSDPPSDERLANAILRTGVGGAPRDYLATAVGQATTSVRVVAYGIAGLIGLLVAFGIHAIQARAFADRVPAVGVLRTVGAGDGWMRRRLLMETAPVAVLAGGLGAGLGFLLGKILQPAASLVLFGHQVPLPLEPVPFLAIVLAVVAMSIGSAQSLLSAALRLRPTESIRETPAVEPPESLEAVLCG
jgi:ABC-type lipoprotein release transport system permease subunit